MPDPKLRWIEVLLAHASNCLRKAALEAEIMDQQGLADDLHWLHVEVSRVLVDLGQGPRRRNRPTP